MNRWAAYRAIFVDTWREARGRQVTRILSGSVVAVLLFFLFAVDLKTENGVLTGCGCFGSRLPLGGALDARTIVSAILYGWYLGIFLAGVLAGVLILAQWVPQTFTRGPIERFLARPLGRTEFLLVRQASTFAIVALGHFAFVLGVFLVTGMKSGVYHGGFLMAATVTPLLVVLAVQGYVTLVGVLTESVPAASTAGAILFVAGWWIQGFKDSFAADNPVGKVFAKAAIAVAWAALPRVAWLHRTGQAWINDRSPVWEKPVLQTAVVIIAAFVLACLAFRKRDY